MLAAKRSAADNHLRRIALKPSIVIVYRRSLLRTEPSGIDVLWTGKDDRGHSLTFGIHSSVQSLQRRRPVAGTPGSTEGWAPASHWHPHQPTTTYHSSTLTTKC